MENAIVAEHIAKMAYMQHVADPICESINKTLLDKHFKRKHGKSKYYGQWMNAHTQSSLEYHVKKKESYYIESGCLKVGLRIGRGKNTSVTLNQGDVFHIPPGLMHMRIAMLDTVIIEVSTTDDDSDSHIVEDGKTYKFVEDN